MSLNPAMGVALTRTIPAVTCMATRGFFTGRKADHSTPKEEALEKLMDNLAKTMEALNVRLDKLEKEKAPRRITIGGKTFNPERILKINSREKTLYIKYPFVLTLFYDKESTDVLVGSPYAMVPITSGTTNYYWKFKSKEAMDREVEKILKACPHVKEKQ